MDSNTFLLRFGLDPGQFELCQFDPELIDGCWVYRAKMRADARVCPHCGKADAAVIKDRRVRKVRCSLSEAARDIVLVEKPRFLCRRCGKTFTPDLRGVSRHASISDATRSAIRRAFAEKQTFSTIARHFGISEGYAIELFDAMYPNVPGRPLPRILCIDEICFVDRIEGKYPAILYDFERKEVVEMVRSRQKKWLEDWFSGVPRRQLEDVRYFISDMYDEYARVARRFLPNAVHVVDLFHVVKLLSEAVRKLRTNAMNAQPRDSAEYAFMKSKWRLFEIRKRHLPDGRYHHAGTGESDTFFGMLMRCLGTSQQLWEAWSSLQEILAWNRYSTWTEAADFVERVASRLIGSGSPLLEKVGQSYRKWKAQIANGLSTNQGGRRLSNGIAECLNNQIKTIKKISNGCVNFGRFRKRVLLVLTYSKTI